MWLDYYTHERAELLDRFSRIEKRNKSFEGQLMETDVATILNDKFLLAMLMTPSMLVGMALIYFGYRLITKFGERFMNAQEKQAEAFTVIANGFDNLRALTEKQNTRDEDIRIALRITTERLDTIVDMLNGKKI